MPNITNTDHTKHWQDCGRWNSPTLLVGKKNGTIILAVSLTMLMLHIPYDLAIVLQKP